MNIQQLPFPKGARSLKNIREYTLPERLYVEQWIVPAGTVVKLGVSQNFGYCVLPEGTKDERGFDMYRRVFRW